MTDIIFQLIGFATLFIPIIIIIFVIVYVIKIVRRTERRADERLQIDKDNAALQQQQMAAINVLNQRLKNIEDTLKEVE
ncbi:hypothetical protein [Radiobacillus sp. PE A8.2]|uniref:hypothetical protein n=1 Tax=Radiobacillus sp. PE A8.2 TaxID=3380349 RepID=UPI00388E587F